MANDDDGAAWHRATAERIGKAVAARRKELGMTAQQLSESCRDYGAPIHRSTITKIENGRPRFDLGELLVLSAALFTPPAALVFPGPYNEEVDVLPGVKASQFDAAQWFSGLRNETFGAQSEGLDAARDLVDSVLTTSDNKALQVVMAANKAMIDVLAQRVEELHNELVAARAEAAERNRLDV